MAKIELTAEQKLAIMESELDLIWRVQEEWLIANARGETLGLSPAYTIACEALVGAQISCNLFKRDLETERETDCDNR